MGNLFQELKRRKVFRVAAVYAIVAWLIIQVAGEILPTFDAPQWVSQTLVLFLFLGFPLALVLAWAFEMTPEGIKTDAAAQPAELTVQSTDRKLIYAILGLVLLVAGFQISDQFLSTTEQPLLSTSTTEQSNAVTRISVNIPEDQFFHPVRGDFDISDDGMLFVYLGVDEGGESLLWVRRWDELNGRPLRDTEGATRPNISPDGEEVVFSSAGSLRVVPINGGLSRTLVTGDIDTPNWSPDGDWVYFGDDERGISRVPSVGGEVETVSKVNADNGEFDQQNAQVLPGNRMLYQVRMADGTSIIKAVNLDSGEIKDLVVGKFPLYSTATGHVLFQALDEPTLLAAPFDLEALELTDAPIPLATGLLLVGSGNAGNVGLSKTGRLVYRLGSNAGRRGTPMWVSREGIASEIDSDWVIPIDQFSPGLALSPEGGRLAITIERDGQNMDLWVKRLDTGPLSRITFAGQAIRHPAWSVDGQSLIYSAGPLGINSEIWTKKADGSGRAELLVPRQLGFLDEASYSPDGQWLIYRQRGAGNLRLGDIYAVDTDMGSEPIPLLVSEFFTHSPTLSRDGKWLAYVSEESGRSEVFVRPFPDADSGRWQVSSNGGSEPVWAHSGKELFYRNGINELVAVQLRDGTSFDWDSQDILFPMTDYRDSTPHPAYAVSPDDQRFVMIKLGAPIDTELILVDNWMEDLK